MRTARVVATATAAVAVAGCAAMVTGMARAADRVPAHRSGTVAADRPAFPTADAAATAPARRGPALRPATSAAPASTGTAPVPSTSTSSAPRPTSRVSTASTAAASTARTAGSSTAAPTPAATRHVAVRHRPAPVHVAKPAAKPKPKPKPAGGHPLPLPFHTGNARRVLTVTATSHHRTVARLQAWTKVRGGWVRHGSSTIAHVGADGMTRHASESRSATPIGSFTLTRAFGHDANPGTPLPYLHTRPSDWWISQPGHLYNTLQQCSSGCGFTRGSPNEHLYYETPFYDYAVVIDYNTRNAPGGVHQGAGSAFFLHVTDGQPTAGCVAIHPRKLVSIMRWLNPADHPRILIGVT